MGSLIERLSTLTAGQPIYASDINAELDQIINLLSGISTDKRVLIVLSSSTKAPLTVDQTGSGDIFKGQVNNVDVIRVLNNGQIKSTVSTGTAPIVTASTTKCTNLNGDLVGGIEASALVRNETTGQTLKGNLRIKKLSTGTYDLVLEVDDDVVSIYRYNPSNETRDLIFTINDLDQSTRVITLPNTVRLLLGYEPTEDTDVARKVDLTNRSSNLLISNIFTGTPRGCPFIAPADCVITRISAGYGSGTPTLDCTLTVHKNGITTGEAVVVSSAASVDTSYSEAINVEVSEGDMIYVHATASTGHSDLFATLSGYWV